MKKKSEKLNKDLDEARAAVSSASRPIVRLERYDGEGASNDEYEDDEDGMNYKRVMIFRLCTNKVASLCRNLNSCSRVRSSRISHHIKEELYCLNCIRHM